jgi:hypothetical protein
MRSVSQIETQCNGGTFTKEFYLGKTAEQRFFDTFQGDVGKDYVF